MIRRMTLGLLTAGLLGACSTGAATAPPTPLPGSPSPSRTGSPSAQGLPVPVTFEEACLLEPQVCSERGSVPHPSGPLPEALLSALHLPVIPAGQPCPVTAGSLVNMGQFASFALSSGPVRPIVGAGAGPVPLADPRSGIFQISFVRWNGWYGFKTLWFSDPAYQGPWRVRGQRIDAPGVMAFGEQPTVGELVVPPGPTLNGRDGYREAPGGTYLRAAGCYAWQVDGVGFSQVIVFQALASGVPVGEQRAA